MEPAIGRTCLLLVAVILLCANAGRCLREERDVKTDDGSPVPVVLWHGMGRFFDRPSNILTSSLSKLERSFFMPSCTFFPLCRIISAVISATVVTSNRVATTN